jgi:6-phosphogluconolactonase
LTNSKRIRIPVVPAWLAMVIALSAIACAGTTTLRSAPADDASEVANVDAAKDAARSTTEIAPQVAPDVGPEVAANDKADVIGSDARPTVGDVAPMGDPFVFSAGAGQISIFRLERQAGALRSAGTIVLPINPGYVAFEPTRKLLYALGSLAPFISIFSIAPGGTLTPIGDRPATAGGARPSVHPSGKWFFVSHQALGAVSMVPVLPDGNVGPHHTYTAVAGAHMAMLDPAGRFLFVPGLSANAVGQFAVDASTGELTPNDPPAVSTAQGMGPRHMAFHPGGKFAYVIGQRNNTVVSFAYDGARGTLSSPVTVSTLPAGYSGKSDASHVLVHPSGKFVYGANRGHDSIVIYSVNQTTGRLTLLGHETGGGQIKVPRDFAVDNTGTFLVVGNQEGSSLSTFRIKPDGLLTRLGEPVPTPTPMGLTIVTLP